MCLIVDVHVAPQVLVKPSPDFAPVWDALSSKRACAYHGGRLTEEYCRVGDLRRILLSLDRQGILRRPVRGNRAVSDAEINALSVKLKQRKACRSDDEHIIALARLTGARLLCSHDQALHRDFTNRKVLSPPGRIYQNRSHLHLIQNVC